MASKKYVARWGFMLGHPLNQPVRIGEELNISGSSILQEGREIAMPSIRGAISNGWLVPADSEQGKKIVEEAEAAEAAGKSPKDAGFAHMSTRAAGEKTVAEADGIDVGVAKAKRYQPNKIVETDADRTVGELKTPTQRPEFVVKG